MQAEDGIREAQESRGLGDVYKRQAQNEATRPPLTSGNIVQETIDTMRKRFPLYERSADYVVDTLSKTPEQITEEIYQYLLKSGNLAKITVIKK